MFNIGIGPTFQEGFPEASFKERSSSSFPLLLTVTQKPERLLFLVPARGTVTSLLEKSCFSNVRGERMM